MAQNGTRFKRAKPIPPMIVISYRFLRWLLAVAIGFAAAIIFAARYLLSHR